MNILYIASPDSIHDQKWMRYVSQNSQYKTYLVTESQNDVRVDKNIKARLANWKISLLPSISSFSLVRFSDTLRSILTLRKYIKEYDISLVHVFFATPHALWVNFINCPSLITTRGSDVLVVLPGLKHNGIMGFHNRLLICLFKRAFNKSNFVTSTSKKQIVEIQQKYNTKNNVLIRTGVDVDVISSDLSQYLPEVLLGKNIIFSPRYFQPIYNIEIQIEALKYLPDNIIRHYTFVFIKGFKDKDYADYLVDSLSKVAGLDYVIFDALEQNEMWAICGQADLTLMTPLSDGTPNSALEAMAAKCPLIVSDLDYDDDLFLDTCLKCNPNDAKDVADKIVLGLDSYPQDLIDGAYQAVIQFGNRSHEMQKVINLYHSIA